MINFSPLPSVRDKSAKSHARTVLMVYDLLTHDLIGEAGPFGSWDFANVKGTQLMVKFDRSLPVHNSVLVYPGARDAWDVEHLKEVPVRQVFKG